MPDEELSDDQILSALSQIEGWAYALPKAKGIVRKYQEAKKFLENLPRTINDMERRKNEIEGKLKEIEPAYREKDRILQAEYLAKEKALRQELADLEAHLSEGVGRLRNEAIDLQSKIETLSKQKAEVVKEWDRKTQAEKDRFNQAVADFEAWKTAHGL